MSCEHVVEHRGVFEVVAHVAEATCPWCRVRLVPDRSPLEELADWHAYDLDADERSASWATGTGLCSCCGYGFGLRTAPLLRLIVNDAAGGTFHSIPVPDEALRFDAIVGRRFTIANVLRS